MSLMEMTLAGSVMILLTALVRLLAIHRLPKGVFGAMWTMIVLRLLIPFRLPSKLSVWAWFAPKETPAPRAAVWAQTSAVQAVAGEVSQSATSVQSAAPALPAGVWIWLTGMILCILAFALAYGIGLKRFREACPEERPDVRRWLEQHPLWRRVRVLRTDRVSAPLTYGLFRPVILLPKKLDAEGNDLKMILCHEWMHIRRLDALWKFILALTACVHWFNPLVWMMFILANRDIELSCDEWVLRMNRGDARRVYAMALIRMEAEKSHPAPLCSHFAQSAIEERITSIMKMKKRNGLTVTLAMMLVLTAGAAFATSAPETYVPETAIVQEGEPALSAEAYAEHYAQYEPYGLTYNAEDKRLYYQGRKVRIFEDMYPIDEVGGRAGTLIQMPDGEVDVHAVRDLSGPIVRNADGSFDPSGVLLGLEASTQEEFDARTKEWMDDFRSESYGSSELEWWTAEDFAAWLEQEKVNLQEMVGTNNRSWTPSEGWFTWDQEHVDAAIAQYEETLEFIRKGGMVSRTGWEDGDVLMLSPGGSVESIESHPTQVQEDVTTGTVEQQGETAWGENNAAQSEDALGGTAEQASDGALNPEMFAEYLPFGLTVKDNALYYQNQRVRSFSDRYQADLFRTVSCEHDDPQGTIRVQAVRRDGKLTGLEIIP